MSGTAVAGAAEGSSAPVVEQGTDENQGAGDDLNNPDENQEEATGSDKFFGWDEETTPFDKLKTAFGVITVVGSAIGAIVALASNIDKLIKLFPAA